MIVMLILSYECVVCIKYIFFKVVCKYHLSVNKGKRTHLKLQLMITHWHNNL